jgi:hypothetical protein
MLRKLHRNSTSLFYSFDLYFEFSVESLPVKEQYAVKIFKGSKT